MSFDWAEYLQVAEALSECGTEAAFRSSVSRSYYAAYHIARMTAERRYGFKIDSKIRGSSHEQVWEFWRTNSNVRSNDEKRAGEDGLALRDERNDADYAGTKPFEWQRKAASANRAAKRVIELLRQTRV